MTRSEKLIEEYKDIYHRPHIAVRRYKRSKIPKIVICYRDGRTSERRDIGIFRDGLGRKVGALSELIASYKERKLK